MELYPPLDVIRLNMTCGAANGYLCLSLWYEKRLRVIFGMLGVHLKLRNKAHFSLWENFTSKFPYLTNIEISND